mgnify:CR=1 FL=1
MRVVAISGNLEMWQSLKSAAYAARAAARASRWGDDSRLFRVHAANTDPLYGEAEEQLFVREEHTLWTEEAEAALARAAAEEAEHARGG